MGKSIHILSDIDETNRTGICAHCGSIRLRRRKKVDGTGWRYACPISDDKHKHRYRQAKGQTCARCEFVPEDRCQLDVHHIDGDHKNNQLSNLMTVCANCHRLLHHGFRASTVP